MKVFSNYYLIVHFSSRRTRQLTSSRKSECRHFHPNHPNSSNKLQSARRPLHLPLYTELQQPLNGFRLGFFAGTKKSNKIWAEVASSAQSAVRLMVCMRETLPELPTNWANASAASLRKLMNPAGNRICSDLSTETVSCLFFWFKELHLPKTAFYLRRLFCHKSLPAMLVAALMGVW